MKIRNIVVFAAAVLAGALGGSIIGPRPAEAVAREILDLQRDVTTLLQNQKDMSDQMLKDHTVLKTLVEQASDNVGKLNATMGSVQKSVQDVQANSGARLDTMSTQVQGLSDNLEEIKSRLGKLNQQLVDLQSAVQGIDSKVSGSSPATGSTPTAGSSAKPSSNGSPSDGTASASPAPSADMLYSNGLRDITSGKYDLARQEFLDYLKYYSDTDLASNAQFYLGEIAYAQKQYQDAVAEYEKVLTGYPKSFKLAPARLKKGMALIALGQKTAGVRELREVIRRYPKTDEDRIAEGELKKLGVSVSGAA
ncbi:MAG TPA: tol-pal system protein YbgF [Candidatus Acidoferrum sp.]|nr:tol-pal system protein YbgF [Candidatus Acidoferrum sp.]